MSNLQHLRHLSKKKIPAQFLSHFHQTKEEKEKPANQNTTSTNTFQPNLCKSWRGEPHKGKIFPPLPLDPPPSHLFEKIHSRAVNEKVTHTREHERNEHTTSLEEQYTAMASYDERSAIDESSSREGSPFIAENRKPMSRF